MRFPLRLWSTYSSLRWTGLFWQSEQAHLSEQVPTHIIQSFIYRRIYYFSEPSEAAVWFLVRSRVNQFLSACKVNLNAETTACMSVLTFRNFRLFSWKFMPQSFVVLQKLFIRSFSWYTIGGFDSHDSVNFKWIWTNWNNIHEKKSCMFRDYNYNCFCCFSFAPGWYCTHFSDVSTWWKIIRWSFFPTPQWDPWGNNWRHWKSKQSWVSYQSISLPQVLSSNLLLELVNDLSTSNEPSLANSSVLDIKFSFLLAPWINKGNLFRGGSRTATTSRMERLLIIVNGWKPLTIITKHSILDVAAALDPPLLLKAIYNKWKYLNLSNI